MKKYLKKYSFYAIHILLIVFSSVELAKLKQVNASNDYIQLKQVHEALLEEHKTFEKNTC